MNTATETGLDASKTASKKVVHKTAEATSELIENNIAERIVKPKHVLDENLRKIKEVDISPEKRQEILNKLRQI